MNFGIHPDGGGGSAVENVLADALRIASVEGFALRHHLVEDRAQAEQIRAQVGSFTSKLLGRHVVQNRGKAGNVLHKIAHTGNTIAENLYGSVPAAHDFCGLEAVMDDLVRSCIIETIAELPADVEQVPNRKT